MCIYYLYIIHITFVPKAGKALKKDSVLWIHLKRQWRVHNTGIKSFMTFVKVLFIRGVEFHIYACLQLLTYTTIRWFIFTAKTSTWLRGFIHISCYAMLCYHRSNVMDIFSDMPSKESSICYSDDKESSNDQYNSNSYRKTDDQLESLNILMS